MKKEGATALQGGGPGGGWNKLPRFKHGTIPRGVRGAKRKIIEKKETTTREEGKESKEGTPRRSTPKVLERGETRIDTKNVPRTEQAGSGKKKK